MKTILDKIILECEKNKDIKFNKNQRDVLYSASVSMMYDTVEREGERLRKEKEINKIIN